MRVHGRAIIQNWQYCNNYYNLKTDGVGRVVGVRCRAVTQVKHLFGGSVLGWMTAGPQLAHRNAEWEVIFRDW